MKFHFRLFIYGLSQLSSHSVRNKKLPAMRVEDQKVLPQETPFQQNSECSSHYAERKGVSMANQHNSLSHTKWMCKYHIVFTPKYRRKIIFNQYRESIGKILRELCGYKGVELIEGHLMPDHVHMLVSIPPKIRISSFMGYLKGKSALMIFDRHANLKYKFGNRHFWSVGYYVSTVGLNEATIQKYIREQEQHDIALDKLSVKEYEDPFRGQLVIQIALKG